MGRSAVHHQGNVGEFTKSREVLGKFFCQGKVAKTVYCCIFAFARVFSSIQLVPTWYEYCLTWAWGLRIVREMSGISQCLESGHPLTVYQCNIWQLFSLEVWSQWQVDLTLLFLLINSSASHCSVQISDIYDRIFLHRSQKISGIFHPESWRSTYMQIWKFMVSCCISWR